MTDQTPAERAAQACEDLQHPIAAGRTTCPCAQVMLQLVSLADRAGSEPAGITVLRDALVGEHDMRVVAERGAAEVVEQVRSLRVRVADLTDKLVVARSEARDLGLLARERLDRIQVLARDLEAQTAECAAAASERDEANWRVSAEVERRLEAEEAHARLLGARIEVAADQGDCRTAGCDLHTQRRPGRGGSRIAERAAEAGA